MSIYGGVVKFKFRSGITVVAVAQPIDASVSNVCFSTQKL